MKTTYDKEADALYLKFTDKKIAKSEEIAENIVIDFDIENNVVGIEVIYFIAKHKKDFFSIIKQVEQSICEL